MSCCGIVLSWRLHIHLLFLPSCERQRSIGKEKLCICSQLQGVQADTDKWNFESSCQIKKSLRHRLLVDAHVVPFQMVLQLENRGAFRKPAEERGCLSTLKFQVRVQTLFKNITTPTSETSKRPLLRSFQLSTLNPIWKKEKKIGLLVKTFK